MSSESGTPVAITPVLNSRIDPLDGVRAVATDLNHDQRINIKSNLLTVSDLMNQALGIWQDYVDNASACDDEFTLVMWIGPQRARQLHQIHLQLGEVARALTESSGIAFRDTIGFSSRIDIVEAYHQLNDGETGPERASAAIRTIKERKERLDTLTGELD